MKVSLIVLALLANTSAVNVRSNHMQRMTANAEQALEQASASQSSAQAEAKWGFLKNIINIHTFFDASDKNNQQNS